MPTPMKPIFLFAKTYLLVLFATEVTEDTENCKCETSEYVFAKIVCFSVCPL
jgi:hypothetical protein